MARMKGSADRYLSVADYKKRTRTKVVTLTSILGMSRFRVTALIYPDRYPVDLTDEEAARIASLLNQKPEYVDEYYRRPAA